MLLGFSSFRVLLELSPNISCGQHFWMVTQAKAFQHMSIRSVQLDVYANVYPSWTYLIVINVNTTQDTQRPHFCRSVTSSKLHHGGLCDDTTVRKWGQIDAIGKLSTLLSHKLAGKSDINLLTAYCYFSRAKNTCWTLHCAIGWMTRTRISNHVILYFAMRHFPISHILVLNNRISIVFHKK